MSGENHAGRAITALKAVLVPERFLQRMQLADIVACGQTFDRRQGCAIGLYRQRCTGLDCHAVQQHGTGTTLARVAADLGSCHSAEIADQMDEQLPRLDFSLVSAAIQGETDRKFHLEWPRLPARSR